MEVDKVRAALVELGFSERKARKLIRSERKKRKVNQKKSDAKRLEDKVYKLLHDLY